MRPMKSKWLPILPVLILVMMALYICSASAETTVSNQLSFDPADTWEEAKKIDLEIDYINEEPGLTWNLIDYITEAEGRVSGFYSASSGRFSWIEVSVDNFKEMPDDIWGFIRYTSTGKVNDVYFCQEDEETNTSVYSYYNARMTLTEVKYYYRDSGDSYIYTCSTGEWDTNELPFDADEVLASLYDPELRIVVANPSPLQAESFHVDDYQENGHNDHDVWLKLNYSGGEDYVTMHYQIFAKNDEDEWYMTWETDSDDDAPYFWIGEDGEHYFKVRITDGMSTFDLQTEVITLTGDAIRNIVYLPDDLTEIEAETFAGDTEIEGMIAPSGLKKIGSKAFSGCTNLRKVYIPSGVSRIESDAFEGIDYLIIYTDKVEGVVDAFAISKGWPCITGDGIE